MSNLVLFDFDGTITYKDTLIEFVRYYRGSKKLLQGMILMAPILVLFKLKIIPNWRAKQIFLGYFFKGESILQFQQKADAFGKEIIPSLLRPKAVAQLLQHLQQNDKVIVVSASAENWLQQWCSSMNLELVATRLEVHNDLITGRIQGQNCHGQEKVNRINEYLKGENFEKIFAYGDSGGDKQLLAYATHPHYRHF